MDKYACTRCGAMGSKKLVPYKIILDDNGESIKFMGQLCERCYKEIFNGPAQNTEKEEDSQNDR